MEDSALSGDVTGNMKQYNKRNLMSTEEDWDQNTGQSIEAQQCQCRARSGFHWCLLCSWCMLHTVRFTC